MQSNLIRLEMLYFSLVVMDLHLVEDTIFTYQMVAIHTIQVIIIFLIPIMIQLEKVIIPSLVLKNSPQLTLKYSDSQTDHINKLFTTNSN